MFLARESMLAMPQSPGEPPTFRNESRIREFPFPVSSLIGPCSDSCGESGLLRQDTLRQGLMCWESRPNLQYSLYFSLLAGNSAEKSSHETASSAIHPK